MNVDNILLNQLYKNVLQMLTYLSDTAQLKLLNHWIFIQIKLKGHRFCMKSLDNTIECHTDDYW